MLFPSQQTVSKTLHGNWLTVDWISLYISNMLASFNRDMICIAYQQSSKRNKQMWYVRHAFFPFFISNTVLHAKSVLIKWVWLAILCVRCLLDWQTKAIVTTRAFPEPENTPLINDMYCRVNYFMLGPYSTSPDQYQYPHCVCV